MKPGPATSALATPSRPASSSTSQPARSRGATPAFFAVRMATLVA
jgi:hypothetical protein